MRQGFGCLVAWRKVSAAGARGGGLNRQSATRGKDRAAKTTTALLRDWQALGTLRFVQLPTK
jgi:hypothetical protein